jgi:hypothetical protein
MFMMRITFQFDLKLLLAGESQALLQMSRVSGYTHVGHFQEGAACHLRNLNAIALLSFDVLDQSIQRSA